MSTINGTLKVGDQVAVKGGGSYSPYKLHTVAKITPSGQVVLENGTRFKDGREVGTSSEWNREYLYAVTPAILDEIKRRKVRADIDRLLDRRALDRISTEALEEVLAVLKKHGGE